MYPRKEGDGLRRHDRRLKYKWIWRRSASGYNAEQLKSWTRFQCSIAKLGQWEMEAIQWFDEYEARIVYGGNHITSREGFLTRLDAEIGAEQLLIEWITMESELIMDTRKKETSKETQHPKIYICVECGTTRYQEGKKIPICHRAEMQEYQPPINDEGTGSLDHIHW